MPKLIPRKTIEQVRELLSAGRLSQRGIADRLGVSRWLVGQVSTGRRKPVKGPPRQVYCKKCQAWVIPPCVACRARAANPGLIAAEKERLAKLAARPSARCGLKPEHREALARVRAEKIARLNGG